MPIRDLHVTRWSWMKRGVCREEAEGAHYRGWSRQGRPVHVPGHGRGREGDCQLPRRKAGSREYFAFVKDLRARVLGKPEISSDGWLCYPGAIEDAFGIDCTYGQIVKNYGVQGSMVEAARRYSPAQVVSVSKRPVVGRPRHISTSFIERQNLTLRMQQRRFTRLTNAFSKKLENHEAAVALYVAHYNLCRVHETLRVTPAMQLGVTDHVWSIGELVEAALTGVTPEPQGRKVGRFTVIDGGVA